MCRCCGIRGQKTLDSFGILHNRPIDGSKSPLIERLNPESAFPTALPTSLLQLRVSLSCTAQFHRSASRSRCIDECARDRFPKRGLVLGLPETTQELHQSNLRLPRTQILVQNITNRHPVCGTARQTPTISLQGIFLIGSSGKGVAVPRQSLQSQSLISFAA